MHPIISHWWRCFLETTHTASLWKSHRTTVMITWHRAHRYATLVSLFCFVTVRSNENKRIELLWRNERIDIRKTDLNVIRGILKEKSSFQLTLNRISHRLIVVIYFPFHFDSTKQPTKSNGNFFSFFFLLIPSVFRFEQKKIKKIPVWFLCLIFFRSRHSMQVDSLSTGLRYVSS